MDERNRSEVATEYKGIAQLPANEPSYRPGIGQNGDLPHP